MKISATRRAYIVLARFFFSQHLIVDILVRKLFSGQNGNNEIYSHKFHYPFIREKCNNFPFY